MKSIDPVERAFDLIRDDVSATAPQPELEARLRRRHAELGSSRGPRRLWLAAAITLALTGGVFAASGGIEWVRSWWYSISVDGQVRSGTIDGDGDRTYEFTADDGEQATVRVQREHSDEGDATRIAIDRSSPLREERERYEDETKVAVTAPERFGLSEIEGHEPIYSGLQEGGARHAQRKLLLPDGWKSSRIVAHRHGDGDRPVSLISRVPFDLLAEGVVGEITERADGGLKLSFNDGRGAQFELMWGGRIVFEPRPVELQTLDGRVRVRVEPRRSRR